MKYFLTENGDIFKRCPKHGDDVVVIFWKQLLNETNNGTAYMKWIKNIENPYATGERVLGHNTGNFYNQLKEVPKSLWIDIVARGAR